MNPSIKTFLVAVGACFSALVIVCSLQGSSPAAERHHAIPDARLDSAAPAAGDAMGSSQVAHVIGAVLLPPNTDKALYFYPVMIDAH